MASTLTHILFRALVLTWAFLPLASMAQSVEGRMFSSYTTREGLSSNNVNALEMSRTGLWWVGGANGLQRFNGFTFEDWSRGLDSVSGSRQGARKVLEDPTGNLWVFNPGAVFVFPSGSRIPRRVDDTRIVALGGRTVDHYPVLVSSGRVWCYGLQLGFFGINMRDLKVDTVIQVARSFHHADEKLATLPFIGQDGPGSAWVVQDFEDTSHVYRFIEGRPVQTRSLPTARFGRIKALLPAGEGLLLFVSTAYTAICPANDLDHPVQVLSRENLPGNYIRGFPYAELNVYEKGSILFSGEKGLYLFNPKERTIVPYYTSAYTDVNLSRQFLFAIREDRQGNIWLGRDGGQALLVFHPAKLKFRFLQSPPEFFNIVYSLAADHKGRVFVAGFEKGLNIFDKEGRWMRYLTVPQQEDGLMASIRNMAFLDSGRLLLKSLFGRLLVLETGSLRFTDLSHLVPARVSNQRNSFDAGIITFGNGSALFSHGRYLLNLDSRNGRHELVVTDSLDPATTITAIVRRTDGILMIGTYDGLYEKVDRTWSRLPGSEGWQVKHLALDAEGRIWVGTTTGIKVLRGRTVERVYGKAQGLLNDFIYGILFDEEGNAWYSSNRGLGCILRDGTTRFYTEASGLQGDEFDTQSFCKGDDGLLYFGGTNGVSGFDPKVVLQAGVTGNMVLTGVMVNGAPFDGIGRPEDLLKLDLPHDRNALTFSFSLNDLGQPRDHVYRVKLDGFDKNWVELGNLHTASYALQPGSYTFHVMGSSDGRSWSPEYILPVTIRPAWWQTYWFMGIMAALAIGALFLLWTALNRRRTAALRQQLKVQEEMQKERERISRDLHDNIGAYSSAMIAGADNLETLATDQRTRDRVMQLRENARNILASIRETIWVLNSHRMTVKGFSEGFMNYCSNILRNYEGIELDFREDISKDPVLSPTLAIQLLRIAQEAVQNAVKHADASLVSVSVECSDILTITVSDNGSGFGPDEAEGHGLRNIRHRAREAGFELAVDSTPGKGTRIRVTGTPV